ncbi:hypothetical protein P152DRAFT_466894 [Eremomyces bilateralis CBS 781.70]|uniref:Peptidase S33 tripeptidyl aminopeptidase-like C-terminal domain-containing protein n=1 Tax=Eremomyces bilateralis CBS 781.70 TaxID=1392243 RepID=A0A6G1G298_9PEZI|nr:uncharacterized protein P152DRAFT_466894 [Eremomyces bilateralis CBS 781.70]KAF1812112.1 hypothetical protein P152DRAFT_466894 [Eremomyces bilateralis CBS 781.70]
MAASASTVQPDWGDYIGTSFTIREMFSILDNLGEGDKLNYWDVSYGMLLGNTAVNMFPDRVNRVILDGVLNPLEYYYTLKESQQYAATDKVWREFLRACMKHPDTCALAPLAKSPEGLEKKLNDMLSNLAVNPLPAGRNIITYAFVKANIISSLYYPTKSRTGLSNVNGGSIRRQSMIGIRCGDKIVRTDDVEQGHQAPQRSLEVSKAFGDVPTTNIAACAQWPFTAKERYDGNFTAKTSQPVLIIGNTWDPVTPLVSAKNYNGYGHLSLSQPPTCTSQHIARYFVNGTLPEHGTKCEPDRGLFVPKQ